MTSGACKRDDRSFGVPTKEKLDKQKSAFRSIWCMSSLFSGWIDALGRPLVSAIRISQVVAFSRTLCVHLNPRIEGTEIVCPQFSGGRFCQVVARTGLTVLQSWGTWTFSWNSLALGNERLLNYCVKEWFNFFFEFLSDLNQAVPNHLADESQTR